uniref:Uncharacterized protein n=1 Tax=Anguilla anguilla TaxID=7936 RepID=A0A0E9V7K9_ANGAN
MGYPQATVVNSSVRIFLQADNHWHTVHTIKFKGKRGCQWKINLQLGSVTFDVRQH